MPERGARLVKISDLARMSGVPTPTIKHYIREGLLPGPARRTSRNMAYYDPRLAARVRAIKDLQHTRYLPLKVIGELLEPPPSCAIRADLDDSQRRHLGDDAGGARPVAMARTRAEVLDALRVARGDLAVLEDLGFIAPQESPAGESRYTGADLEILSILDEARASGLGELFTLDVLVSYAEAVRALVRAELAVFRRQMAGGARLPGTSVDAIARQASRLGERLVVALRQKLLVSELEELAKTGQTRPL